MSLETSWTPWIYDEVFHGRGISNFSSVSFQPLEFSPTSSILHLYLYLKLIIWAIYETSILIKGVGTITKSQPLTSNYPEQSRHTNQYIHSV